MLLHDFCFSQLILHRKLNSFSKKAFFFFALFLRIHVLDTDFYCSPVSLELLNLGQLHDCRAHVPQTFSSEVSAGNVLLEGSQVDARVLLGESVRCYL